MVAYLDLIFLENTAMNYLILYTVGKLMNREIKKIRLISSSIVGALYVFSLYVKMPVWVLNVSKIIIAMLLIKIAYTQMDIKEL